MTGRHTPHSDSQTQPVSHNLRPRLITSNITLSTSTAVPRPRNNSSCGNNIGAQIRLDVSRGPSRDEATVLWVFIFCALNIFAYNKYFPERATMISRLAARSCVSGYTDWVFIEMWSMTNPFSSILATSPEPGLFRPLKWCPSLPGKITGELKLCFIHKPRVKVRMYTYLCENHKPGSPVTRLAIATNFTQISPAWILFGDKFALCVHDFVQNLF